MEHLALAWPWIDLCGQLLAVVMTVIVIQQRREPRALLAWILSFFLLPFVGPALWFLLGAPRFQLHARRRAQRKRLGPGVFHEGPVAVPHEPLDALVHRMLQEFNPFPARPGNRVTFEADGESFFADLFAAIAAARDRVHLAFYLVRDDATGRAFCDLLERKVREGVTVRLLYDHVGSIPFHRRHLKRLRAAGVRVAPFLPVNLLRRQFHINFRNHRKIVAIDGRIAYTGGINIGDEYRTGRSRWGVWRDLGIRVEGPAVRDLEAIFADDWRIATDEEVTLADFPAPFKDGTAIQVVPGGPDDPFEPIRSVYITLLARTNAVVRATTPYFIPDSATLQLMRAARLRGARADIVVPARGNHFWPHHATMSFCGDLRHFAIRPYVYTPGMLHTKALTCDGRIGVAGSPNLDNRSFRLNFEVALVLYNERDVAALDAQIDAVLLESAPFDAPLDVRPLLGARLLRGLGRVFGPVL